MLTKSELKWLEERKNRLLWSGVYSNPCLSGSWKMFLNPDYKDAAEFEARVAQKLAEKIPLVMMMARVDDSDFIMDAETALMLARLDVEYE